MEPFDFPEGATPIHDCSDLIPEWVRTLEDLNRVEAENIYQAQKKYLTKTRFSDPAIWFRMKELQTLHYDMLCNVWKWAGVFRKSVTTIGVAPGLIPSQLADLCAQVESWSREPVELTFLERAARIHHRLVSIHPFENGNGRFSRLVADRYLLGWECPHPVWPDILNQKGPSRMQYIQSLQNADKGDYEPLLELMHELGANDPGLEELLRKKIYSKHLKSTFLFSIVKALLRRGANRNLKSRLGDHPLVQLFIDAGAKAEL